MKAPRSVRIALAGGGSGGHLFPGIAVARMLSRGGGRPVLYGSERSQEAAWVGRETERVPLPVAMLPRRGRELPSFLLRLLRAFDRSLRDLRSRRPDLVLGLGGYASVPPGLAALVSGRPLLLLEQNVVPGMANRLLAGLGGRIAASYGGSLEYLPRRARGRARVVGNPIRAEVLSGHRSPGRFGLAEGRPTLLVVGGSQGASGLNARVLQAAPALAERRIQVIHLSGEREMELVQEGLARAGVRACVLAFTGEMGRAYATADLVLCRAGGTTLAELCGLGKPSVLVPYPHHRDQHQFENARILAAAGAARVIPESELSPERFASDVADLVLDWKALERMGRAASGLFVPDAAGKVARWAAELTQGAAR